MTDTEPTMTTRYTEAEWRNIIDEAERDLPSSFPQHKAPNLGTPDFAKCIDHTLLKLEATAEQIDDLCEEARRHAFGVGSHIFLSHLLMTELASPDVVVQQT